MMEIFGNFKFTPFYLALEMTIDWFIQNYETCRNNIINIINYKYIKL